MEEHLSPDRILDIGLGLWPSKVLLSAVELDIFSHLSSDPLELGTLAGRIEILEDGAQDLLDALLAIELLHHDAEGPYAGTPATAQVRDRGSPSYSGGRPKHANRAVHRRSDSLTEAQRSGEPRSDDDCADETYVQDPYEDPVRLRLLIRSMTAFTAAESGAWMNEAGCTEARVVHLEDPRSMVGATK